MAFLELSVEVAGLNPQQAEAACFDTGALSVSFTDVLDEPVLEPRPGEMRLWRRTRLQALYPAAQAQVQLIAQLAAALGVDAGQICARAVADRVWEREWLRDFHALRFGRRLWVCPHHESVEEPSAVVVKLDPGLAFGTGTHPSTALCLQWLDGAALQDWRVVDYGCGSGVLAIAALKLGAREAFAYDIDPQALLATEQNAAANGVLERLRIVAQVGEIPAGCDLLLANILADVLISTGPQFAPLLRSGGECLLAGILAHQADEVAAGVGQWFDMRPYAQRADWVALAGVRRST